MHIQTITIFIFTLILSTSTAIAREYDDAPYYDDVYQGYNEKLVTFYKHCDFTGERISLPEGNYPSLNEFELGNDQISSIRVPKGKSVTIFSDSRFRGKKLTVTNDVFCLPKSLNDTTSSIVINNSNYQKPISKPRPNQSAVTIANVTAVETSIGLLKLNKNNVWVFEIQNDRQRYNEQKRDRNGVHLKRIGNPGKVTINLAQKKLELHSSQLAYPVSVPIVNSWTDPANLRQTTASTNNSSKQPSRRINGPCFKYKAYTSGGPGGLRFYGKKDLLRLTSKPVSGKICHDGKITMELNKNNPNTTVYAEINGKRFSFNAGDKGHAYVNTWYRKHVRLVVE